MKLAIIGGTGYVGLTTAVCFAFKKHRVYCVGRSKEKIEKLQQGIPPIYEEKLEEMLKTVLASKTFVPTLNLEEAVIDSDVSFLCVGTPSREDGSIDLSQIIDASKQVGKALKKKKDYHVVVVKSTVVPGTTEEIVIPILEKESCKKAGKGFGVCMNPEFLREGQAIKDFMFPKNTGIVIGELDKKSGNTLYKLYKDFDAEILRTSLRAAEMIKYARNSYLAKDISFANEIANICQRLGIDFLEVKKGMEMDVRIGKGRFLNAGVGFGGSCFPKDVKALIEKAKAVGIKPRILESSIEVNELQPYQAVEMLKQHLKELKGKKIAVLGLSFKPGTDDMREAPSIKIVNALIKEGAEIYAYDPVAMENAKRIFSSSIKYVESAKEALANADACVIVTDWPEFGDGKLYRHLRGEILIDGRRIVDPRTIPPRLLYCGIGYPSNK
ncbi:UDP-glucose 6-dehydrogenase [Candidatus Bathyarchaeota archaeon]|nr:MAG: UDP-glucose 6-dehydrogenase [Candidatus Bathyarchaeota archaeon]